MKLYIGNVPYTVAEGDLQDFFSGFGLTPDSINVIRDRFSGESRGFAFVEFDDVEIGNQAIATCNGKDLAGRSLVVNEARPMGERRPRGGGGGGGGGGRNRY